MRQTGVSLKTSTTNAPGIGPVKPLHNISITADALPRPKLPMKSPLQQASLSVIGGLSPRDAVIASQKQADEGTAKGYYVAKTPNEGTLNFSVPKGKGLSIIAEEAKYRSLQPSPVTYDVKVENDWNKKGSRNTSTTILPREKRVTEANLIEIKN